MAGSRFSAAALVQGARARWVETMNAPGGRDRLVRGAACGAFAAMLPAFGLHLAVPVGMAALLRGSCVGAACVCLLLDNPLTQAFVLPL